MARAASGRLRQEAYSLCCSITHMREGREFPNVTVVRLEKVMKWSGKENTVKLTTLYLRNEKYDLRI